MIAHRPRVPLASRLLFAAGRLILDGARWMGRRGLATPGVLLAALRAASALGLAGFRLWRGG